jgi:UDP-glucose 4-epimerase
MGLKEAPVFLLDLVSVLPRALFNICFQRRVYERPPSKGQSMKVLVTGGSGLVGRYVVNELVRTASVEVLDLNPFPRSDIPSHTHDILDFPRLVPLLKGFDAVVHLAGIPHPLNDPAEKVFRVNTLGTFNMLEAAALNGIKRFVFMSSESTLGFAFSANRMWPEFVPIDERHPLRPQDPYGISKVCGEQLCAAYSRKTGMQTICLRPPWVWIPERKEITLYRTLIKDYPAWSKNLWAYIHAADVAQAVRLSVEASPPSIHTSYFICADENWTSEESRALLERFYPETTKINPAFSGRASLISNLRARSELGFTPRYKVSDLLSSPSAIP